MSASTSGDSMAEDTNDDMVYYMYRKTIERIPLKKSDGVSCLSDAWKVGKKRLGEPLIDPKDYDDRYIRIRMMVIRKDIDEDKE